VRVLGSIRDHDGDARDREQQRDPPLAGDRVRVRDEHERSGRNAWGIVAAEQSGRQTRGLPTA
jgi:hypothetical protein